MRYLLMLALVVPVFAGQEVICPATVTIPHFVGVPNQGPSTAVLETLFYDDGTAANAWAWYQGGNGWGYHFQASGPNISIQTVGFYIWAGWPVPGSNTCQVWVLDESGGQPGTEYIKEDVTVTPGDWTWYNLSAPPNDADGSFFGFYLQKGDYPNCTGISCDAAQENPATDWYYYSGSFGNGFPSNDFLIRFVVDVPGVGEESSSRIWSVNFPTITDGSFNLRFNLKKPANITLSTYDLTGKMVDRTKSTVESKMSVDLSRLPNGVYFLRADNGTEVKTGRILIVH